MLASTYRIRVPGSLMLFGEHAVLHGEPGIVAAIDRYLHFSLKPRQDTWINVMAEGIGSYQTKVDDFHFSPKFSFVLKTIESYLPKLKRGFDLEIQRDFTEYLGFGSSACSVVGVLALLSWWLTGRQKAHFSLVKQALVIVRAVQGKASGGDVIASVYGGVVKYRGLRLYHEKHCSLPLKVLYSGYKTKTPAVIEQVELLERTAPLLYRKLYQLIGQVSRRAWVVLRKRDYYSLGKLMNFHQGLQKSLGVEDQALSEILTFLSLQPQVYGAKISGAGLGDSVIILGELVESFNYQQLTYVPQIFEVKVAKGLIYGQG